MGLEGINNFRFYSIVGVGFRFGRVMIFVLGSFRGFIWRVGIVSLRILRMIDEI